MHRLVLCLAIVCTLATAVSAPAQNPPSSSKMTPEEVKQAVAELQKQGYTKVRARAAVDFCGRDKELFAIYKNLAITRKVRDELIVRSFVACKGVPKDLHEYWDYVFKYRFHPAEVQKVFELMPTMPPKRFVYFQYRAGGVADGIAALAEREKAKTPEELAKHEKYSEAECIGVFHGLRTDIKLAKEYFERRDKGEDARTVWPEIVAKLPPPDPPDPPKPPAQPTAPPPPPPAPPKDPVTTMTADDLNNLLNPTPDTPDTTEPAPANPDQGTDTPAAPPPDETGDEEEDPPPEDAPQGE